MQFICGQDWDIAFLEELTSEEVIDTLTNKLNENRCVCHNAIQYYAIMRHYNRTFPPFSSECKTKDILYSRVFSDKLPLQAHTGREIYAYIYRLV